MSIKKLREKREYVVAAYLLGKSTTKLGTEFGINSGQVSRFLRDECGVKMRSRSKVAPLIFDIIDLVKGGNSKYVVARRLGLSERTIGKVVSG